MQSRTLAALAAMMMLAGCATAIRGTTEKVVIQAAPEDAAIRTSLGHSCPKSPCEVEVSRKTDFKAFAEREGYQPGEIQIATKMGGGGGAAMAGNILVGGIIGVGVDAASGATLDHYPNPAVIVLKPIDPANPATPVVSAPPPPPKPRKQTPTS